MCAAFCTQHGRVGRFHHQSLVSGLLLLKSVLFSRDGNGTSNINFRRLLLARTYCPVSWETTTTVEPVPGFDPQLLPEKIAIICCPRRVNIVVSVTPPEAFIDDACIRYMTELVRIRGIPQLPLCFGAYYLPENLYYIECESNESSSSNILTGKPRRPSHRM